MSTFAYTVNDSTTMLRRNLRRLQRYPSLTLLLVGMPIVFMLLFGALAWSVGIALASYLWARHLYAQRRSAWPGRPACSQGPR